MDEMLIFALLPRHFHEKYPGKVDRTSCGNNIDDRGSRRKLEI